MSAGATTWTDLPTIVANGNAYAATNHFSTFVVRQADDNNLCPTFASRCGMGDVTGTWRVAAFCNGEADHFLGPTTLLAACPAVIPVSPMASAGSVTLNADLTMTHDVVVPYHTTATASLPSSCLGGFNSCADVATAIATPPYFTASCTGTPQTACDCTAVLFPPLARAQTTGTYQHANGRLGFGGLGNREYCVNEGNLHYRYGSESNIDFGFIFTR